MSKAGRITLISFVLIAVAFVIMMILAMTGERNMLKRRLNNPFINSDYQKWEVVNLDENVRVKLPETWNLEYADGRIIVINSSGEQIADGTKLPIRSNEEENAFLEYIYESTLTESNLLWTSGLIYGNMASNRAAQLILGNGKTETYVSVDLPCHNDYRYFLCFFSDGSGALYRDEAEAIAYSLDTKT